MKKLGVFFIVSLMASLFFCIPVQAEKKLVVNRKTFGCINQGFMETILNYQAQNEEVPFLRALRVGLKAGICTLFEPGEEIFLVKHDPQSQMVLVKKRNSNQAYWILETTIK